MIWVLVGFLTVTQVRTLESIPIKPLSPTMQAHLDIHATDAEACIMKFNDMYTFNHPKGFYEEKNAHCY
jgi:hypothetical protein